MKKIYKMIDSGKIYQVQDNYEFLTIVKDSNSHTKILSIDSYITQQSGVMKNLWGADMPEHPTADSLINAWKIHNIIAEQKP